MKLGFFGFHKIVLVAMVLLSTGCSSPSNYSGVTSEPSAQPESRMIVNSAAITIEVKQPNEIYTALTKVVEKQSGYIVNSRLSNEDSYHATVKVPSGALENTLIMISEMGKETNKTISTTDVTDQFKDQEAELKNLIALRERLKTLLVKAVTVKEVLEVEEQLNRLQTKIDQLEGRLKSLASGVSYSTIDITAEKKKIYGPIGYAGVGLWWLVEKLFVIQ